ncbi:MAG: D-alanyl-D-alanine carboxypeptidase DacF precursor [Lentisphaerae bacterium ADurb.Bin242]|nr:MAG: D-alanyl-D-alanine carboxypeptidase DacF precursor [Lentisphaerae bacterium ADurb.Bin242]
MKFRYIFLIVSLIVLAHVVVLYLCFREAPGDAAQPKLNLSPKTAGQPSAAATPPAAKPQGMSRYANLRSAAATPPSVPALPYNYTYAVSGDIPELAASANAHAGILLDADTRTVLWAKNTRTPYPIASMTKIMTALLAYEDILAGRNGLTLETPIHVTRTAMKIGGSQVWLDPTETFQLQELLQAVSIKSANDAAYLVAEYLGGGDVSAFVRRMNTRAAELNMTKTRFFNPHGLPGDNAASDNVSSPEDMARLAERTLSYPMLMKWASMQRADFRAPGSRGHLKIVNHNHLLPGGRYPAAGVDGLKTGFINRSGYCVTATCSRDGKRLIAVVVGFDTAKNRDLFVKKLLDWGYPRLENPAAALQQTQRKAVEMKTKAPAVKKSAPPKKSRNAKKVASVKK